MIEGICFGGAFWPVSTMNEVVFFKFFRCVFRSCFTLCSYVTFFPAMYGLSIYLGRSVSILLAKHKSVASSAYIFETYFAFPGKYSSFCVTNQIEVEEVICIFKCNILKKHCKRPRRRDAPGWQSSRPTRNAKLDSSRRWVEGAAGATAGQPEKETRNRTGFRGFGFIKKELGQGRFLWGATFSRFPFRSGKRRKS